MKNEEKTAELSDALRDDLERRRLKRELEKGPKDIDDFIEKGFKKGPFQSPFEDVEKSMNDMKVHEEILERLFGDNKNKTSSDLSNKALLLLSLFWNTTHSLPDPNITPQQLKEKITKAIKERPDWVKLKRENREKERKNLDNKGIFKDIKDSEKLKKGMENISKCVSSLNLIAGKLEKSNIREALYIDQINDQIEASIQHQSLKDKKHRGNPLTKQKLKKKMRDILKNPKEQSKFHKKYLEKSKKPGGPKDLFQDDKER